MNSFEIMSINREKLALGNEGEFGSRSLLAYVNLGYLRVAVALRVLLADVTISRKSLSVAVPASIGVPGDCEEIINLERQYAALGAYRFCREVKAGNRAMIGTRNYPSNDESNPLFIRTGRNLEIYPVGTSAGDCRLEYRRRIPDLVYGKAAAATNGGTAITLDVDASKIDDVYNGHYLHTYVKNGADMVLEQIQLITDYVGSTRVCTLDGAITSETAEDVWYALEPLFTTELHYLVVKAGMAEIAGDKTLQLQGKVTAEQALGAEADLLRELRKVTGEPEPVEGQA